MLTILNLFLTALFGLANGQTAYLNVLAVPAPPTAALLRTPPPGICDITLAFFDGQSNMLKSRQVMINPGSSASLPLGTGDLGAHGKGRTMVYGEVQLMSDSDPSCQLINSLEVTDPNGRTEVLIPLGFGGRAILPGS
jgi:hypothetical protein